MPQITNLKLCAENGCNQVWELQTEMCSCESTQFFPLECLNLSTHIAKGSIHNVNPATQCKAKVYWLSQPKKTKKKEVTDVIIPVHSGPGSWWNCIVSKFCNRRSRISLPEQYIRRAKRITRTTKKRNADIEN